MTKPHKVRLFGFRNYMEWLVKRTKNKKLKEFYETFKESIKEHKIHYPDF